MDKKVAAAPENGLAQQDSMLDVAREVLRIALPLMVSAGTFSLVLFADRTLLLKYDGTSMSASMAGGNLFWVLLCVPVGIASMTGATVSQYVGADQRQRIGRFLWQSIWMSLMTIPFFVGCALIAPWLFRSAGQPEALVPLEATYMRFLLIGGVGMVLETALSGFFSGTERTQIIMWTSLASGFLNLILDLLLIFGAGPIPALGVAGAAIASSSSFWFKFFCYAAFLFKPRFEPVYRIRGGFGFDFRILRSLLFFGFPTGLMNLTESGGFTVIVLRIGRLGDIPLRATTMAINFNMVAFIPLVGVSIAASVLVGRHLLQNGPQRAARSVYAALLIGIIYSSLWLVAYLTLADQMMALYELSSDDSASDEAIAIAHGLLGFVAIYVVLDATQLVVAGALRGAGDTWYVLLSGFTASLTTLLIGMIWEPQTHALHWWWWMVTLWVWLLASVMILRFLQGRWKKMRMV
ncbi:MAG: MATE family efflux transporter [Pirellulales bacterium]|nr:MATE family efflux transporter [Pirellulales bacterium]